MKKLVLFMALFGVSNWAVAQITVTNATFPVAGDSLKTATDLNPSGVAITPPGGPFTWDFSGLTPDVNQVTVFQPASDGAAFANFSEAELVTIGQANAETYYSVSATSFDNLGFSGSDPNAGIPIQTEFKFTPPVPQRRAPLNFIDNHIAESSLALTLPIDSAISAILAQLGIPVGFVDSLRILGTAIRFEIVDAYGSLTIPGGSYDVLREKRTEYRDTHIEIHTFGVWLDVTNQAGAAAGFGQDTVTTYLFISNTEKEFIASVTVDSTGLTPTQVEYKDNGIPNATGFVAGAMPQALVSPNPVSNQANFQLKNWKPGNYEIRIVDVRGMTLRSHRFPTAAGEHSEKIEAGALPAGQFFFQIVDESGRSVAAGKFLKN